MGWSSYILCLFRLVLGDTKGPCPLVLCSTVFVVGSPVLDFVGVYTSSEGVRSIVHHLFAYLDGCALGVFLIAPETTASSHPAVASTSSCGGPLSFPCSNVSLILCYCSALSRSRGLRLITSYSTTIDVCIGRWSQPYFVSQILHACLLRIVLPWQAPGR